MDNLASMIGRTVVEVGQLETESLDNIYGTAAGMAVNQHTVVDDSDTESATPVPMGMGGGRARCTPGVSAGRFDAWQPVEDFGCGTHATPDNESLNGSSSPCAAAATALRLRWM